MLIKYYFYISSLSEMTEKTNIKNFSRAMKAISDPNRLRIMKMLSAGPLCVCEITSVMELAASTISKHLSILRDAELIDSYKDGRWVNYKLAENPPAYIEKINNLLDKHLSDDVTESDFEKAKNADRESICGNF